MVVEERSLNLEKTVYEEWVEAQGIPVVTGFNIPNLKRVALGPWERTGGLGAYIQLEGTEDVNDSYVCEIPPGKSLEPERHLYEEVILILSGRGATTVWYGDGPRRTFEWHEGSLFAIPLNAWHQLHNGQGNEACRFYAVTSAPVVMNLFHNLDFVVNNPYEFTDRFNGQEDFFSGEGRSLGGRIWETNFVEDTRDFPLLDKKERGAGGKGIVFEMAEGALITHVSEFPIGTYKKAHRHGPGAHVVVVKGQGYSLLWEEGKEKQKVPWEEGSVLVPPNMWFHQHFNTGQTPARYIAIRWGSSKYPVPWHKYTGDFSLKEGGNQIEYEDEDPIIRKMFEEELAKNGVECRMDEVVKSGK